MAVKRVFGTVNGTEVELEYTGGLWTVPVPYIEDAEYVVEIIAEDEAGNRSYMAKLLLVVNSAELTVHAVQIPYYAVLQVPPDWQYVESGLKAEAQEQSWSASAVPERYLALWVTGKRASEERRYICSVLDSTWEKTSMCDFESVP